MTDPALGAPRRLRVHGLTLLTPFEPPGTSLEPSDAEPDGEPAITVQTLHPSAVPADAFDPEFVGMARAGGPILSGRRFDGGFELRFPRFAGWTHRPDAARLTGWTDPAIEPEFLAITLFGAVSAVLVTLAGDLCLHASAVELDGGVIAFAGPSGRGKSTTLALAAMTGAPCFADDVLRVRTNLGPPVAHRGTTVVRLRPAAAGLADQLPGALDVRSTIDGRLAVSLQASTAPTLPLRAIVLPRPDRAAATVTSSRMPATAAFLALHSALRITGWTEPEIVERQFGQLASLSDQVPVITAGIPWGPPFPPDTGARLLEAVARSAGL